MMQWPWVVWLILIMVSFAVLEGYAFKHPEREWTLSRTVATWGASWPGTIFLFGLITGAAAVHFFWHWGCEIAPGGG